MCTYIDCLAQNQKVNWYPVLLKDIENDLKKLNWDIDYVMKHICWVSLKL